MSDFDRWFPFGFPIPREWPTSFDGLRPSSLDIPVRNPNQVPRQLSLSRRQLARLMGSLEKAVAEIRKVFDDPDFVAKLGIDEIEAARQWAERSVGLLETMAKACAGGKNR